MIANTESQARPDQSAQALLQEAPLRELIAARVVTGITATGGHGGFVVEIRFGEGTGVLANARGAARLFASLSTVAALLQKLGHPRFDVDATAFRRGRIRAAQPERSAAMKGGKLLKAADKNKTTNAKKAIKNSPSKSSK